MGGMVLETNMTEILLRIEEQNKIAKEEVRSSIDVIQVFVTIHNLDLKFCVKIASNELLH